jgi:hypothetical protein
VARHENPAPIAPLDAVAVDSYKNSCRATASPAGGSPQITQETAMTHISSRQPSPTRSSPRRESTAPPRTDRERRRQKRASRRTPRARRTLGRYIDRKGRTREVIARQGSAGSVLVVDRDAETLGDRRLIAHLAADEPPENAAVVCGRFLLDARREGCRCRLLTAEDLQTAPFSAEEPESPTREIPSEDEIIDRHGRSYRLELVQSGMSIPQLRWCRLTDSQLLVTSVREAVAGLESYEPVRTLTRSALAQHGADSRVSTTVLRVELERVLESPIVLNRGLRDAVLAAIARDDLSMSEIAIRCERVKRDCRGNVSGETSWLARRLGMLPEGGHSTPTPWIHSDVLGLIARSGLNVSPREVEL